jgi:hypothetical protein
MTEVTMATRLSSSPGAGLAATARGFYLAPEARLGVDTLKTIAMFCGAGLVALLLSATNGLDLSIGFF